MAPRFDVLAVGELNPDMILSGIAADGPVVGTEQRFDTQTLTLGSSTAIACVLMQRLGLVTAMAAKVGDDDYGRYCLDVLRREGVDTGAVRTDPAGATGVTISLSYAQDRLLLTRYGTMSTFGMADIDPGLAGQTRHLHCGSFFIQSALRPDLPALFAAAQDKGATTSLDLGWDPDETWHTDVLAQVLPHTDVILPNRVELAAVTGTDDVQAGLGRLHALGAREIALKLGREGARLSTGEGQTHHAGFAITPLDTTGAGDAFNAGYLRARLAGLGAMDRLRLGNACGALTAQALGGTGGLKGLADALALIRTAGEPLPAL